VGARSALGYGGGLMAYTVELDEQCAAGCGRRAVVELRDRHNAPRGRWCRECGQRQLGDLERVESAPQTEGDPARMARALRYDGDGLSLRQVAARMGVSVTQVRRLLGLLDSRGLPYQSPGSRR
jgi:hypothetical protein